MGYQVYKIRDRYCGYGVPAYCEHPSCDEEIDRGFAYACGGEPNSEYGCDRYFCHVYKQYHDLHNGFPEVCERCMEGEDPFPYKEDHPTWIKHLLTDDSKEFN